MTLPLSEAWSAVARNYLRNIVPGFEPAARALAALAGIGAGNEVLDIGCGPGTASFIAKESGAARVVGVDISAGMLEIARERALGFAGMEFLEGNALDLPVPAQSFDVVISNFGVIFAPDPARAVAEMARVLRAGGRTAFTAWLRGGTTASYYEAVYQHLPEPPAQHDHYDWGDPREPLPGSPPDSRPSPPRRSTCHTWPYRPSRRGNDFVPRPGEWVYRILSCRKARSIGWTRIWFVTSNSIVWLMGASTGPARPWRSLDIDCKS